MRYALVSFFGSKDALISGTEPLGQAAVRIGTALDALVSSPDASVVLEGFGAVPALPAGAETWKLASDAAAIDGPGRAYATTLGGKVGASYRVGSATYVITNANSAALKKAPNAKKVTIPARVSINGKSYKLTAVKAKAFAKSSKCRTVVVKSTTMTSFKKAFSKSKVKTVRVPTSKKKAYKKLLTKAKCGLKVKVK